MKSIFFLIFIIPISVFSQSVYISEWTIQNKDLKLEQNIAKQIVINANDWLTNENPNDRTARQEDNGRISVKLDLEINKYKLSLLQITIGTIVIDSGFNEFLNNDLIDSIINRNCFWINEKLKVINPSLIPDYIYINKVSSDVTSIKPHSEAKLLPKFIRSNYFLDRIKYSLRSYFFITNPNKEKLNLINSNKNVLGVIKCSNSDKLKIDKSVQWLRFGDINLFNVRDIRIALGDNLLYQIINSDSLESTNNEYLNYENEFSENSHFEISLDELKYKFDNEVYGKISFSNNEPNSIFWNNGNLNLNLEYINYSLGLLLPFSGGNTNFGFYKKRILEPTFGLIGEVNYSNFNCLFKYSPWLFGFNDSSYVNSQDLLLYYNFKLKNHTSFSIGLNYNVFDQLSINNSNSSIVNTERYLSLYSNFNYSFYEGNSSIKIVMSNLSLIASFETWLTNNFGFKFSGLSNNLLRSNRTYEHPFIFFLTPKVSF